MKIIFVFLIFVTASLTLAAPSYLGDWIQRCTIIGEDDVVKNLLLIDSKVMDQVVIAYEEENCKSPYLIFKRQYQLGSEKSLINENKVDVEMSVVKVSYQSLTDEVTESLNMIAFCGATDWQTNKEKIVTGQTCQDYKAPALGTIIKHQFSTKSNAELFHNDDPVPYYKLMP